jgi:phage-related minor tail protein
MSFLDDGGGAGFAQGEWEETGKRMRGSANGLGLSAGQFAGVMVRAFAQATAGGKQFDDVLKSLTLRLSNMAVQNAFKPLARDLAKGWQGIFGGGPVEKATIAPFASGGVIGSPTYFPMSGGFGLAGEAGPEAIMPLSRGSDGRLGIAAGGASAPGNITVHIATPDPGSFRRSESYITGQIARAVARGQRGL